MPYLEKVGRLVPLHCNPAEIFLSLVNRDFAAASDVDEMLAAWKMEVHSIQPMPCLGPTMNVVLHVGRSTPTIFGSDPRLTACFGPRCAVPDPASLHSVASWSTHFTRPNSICWPNGNVHRHLNLFRCCPRRSPASTTRPGDRIHTSIC